MFNLTRPRNWLRLLGALALLAALFTTTGGGCSFIITGDDDDDDDDCYRVDDDDDDGWYYDDDDDDDDCITFISTATLDGDPVGFRLHDYVLEASEDPGTHPVRRLTEIRELNVFRELGPGLHGSASFEYFTGAVLQENPDLLGLPPGAGRLRFFAAEDTGAGMVVTYVQTADARAAPDFEPGAGVFFLFDAEGQLTEIHNLTTVPISLIDVAVPTSTPSPSPEPPATDAR